MTKSNLYIDINVLQTVPSSNINRDDTGSPKTALYGGVMRSRVSSQSWKRAMRNAFVHEDGLEIGFLTKKANTLLESAMKNIDSVLSSEDILFLSEKILELLGSKPNDKKSALLYISPVQIEHLAQYAIDNSDILLKELKKANKGGKKVKDGISSSIMKDNTLDLALFGRMFASAPELNINAAAQVAHAISTHEVVPEFDYFTALDDLKKDNESGAAMIGTNNFNSATLYRYANLNVNELVANLDSETALQVTRAFIKEFVLSMPTGKENSYANKTLPSYVMVTLRDDTPVNLVSAFENPVTPANGYMQKSISRLEAEYSKLAGLVDQPIGNWVWGNDSEIGDNVTTKDDLLTKVREKLSEVVPNENVND